MWFTFTMYDPDDERKVSLEGQAETVPEVLEYFLSFMKGCGYPYIQQTVAIYDNGKQVGTEL